MRATNGIHTGQLAAEAKCRVRVGGWKKGGVEGKESPWP